MTTFIKLLGRGAWTPEDTEKRERDLVDQINRALRERDAEIARIRAEPTIFAMGSGTTDGAGGIATLFSFGCTLDVAGTTVRMRFEDERPSTDFVYTGLFVGGAARMAVSPATGSRSTEVADVRFYTDTGLAVNASTTVFTCLVWAMGPRA